MNESFKQIPQIQKLQAKRKQSEYKLQVSTVAHIRSCFPHILLTHAGKGIDAQQGLYLQRMGYLAGTPDLILWWKNGFAGIELKTTAKQSEGQATFQLLFERLGGKYFVCTSVQEVHDTLVAWGNIPMHNSFVEPVQLTVAQKNKMMLEVFKPF